MRIEYMERNTFVKFYKTKKVHDIAQYNGILFLYISLYIYKEKKVD